MASSNPSSRLSAFLWVILAYIIGIGLGALVGHHFYWEGRSLIFVVAAADIVATIVVFIFSYIFKNSSFYDPYWSVIPIVIAAFLVVEGWDSGADHLRSIAMLALVSFWGIRLTYNWAVGWPGLHHQDWRYDDLQEQNGKWYWLVSFSGIHMFPTVLVFLGCLTLFPSMTEAGNAFNIIDVIAIAFTLGAIIIELVADEQLRAFVRRRKDPGEALMTGLWKYSRHPNYFGETAFWWGLFLFTLAAKPELWWYVIGPVSMTILFHFISIPMIEKRSLKRRPEYQMVIDQVPRWIPWFPKK